MRRKMINDRCFDIKFAKRIDDSDDTKTFLFHFPRHIKWNEGDHVRIAFNYYQKKKRRLWRWMRYMSIMTLPEEGYIGITTKIDSNSIYKKALMRLRPGDTMRIYRSNGSFMRLIRKDRPLVLASIGVGMAAFRPLMLAYHKEKHNIPAITNLTINRGNKRLYEDDLLPLTKESPINLEYMHNRQDFYKKLYEYVKTGEDICEQPIFYFIGSHPFRREAILGLIERGVAKEDIRVDTPMRERYFAYLEGSYTFEPRVKKRK